ncbi:unnamed protein product [Soboliphyme baturini]|uniref:DUF4201 domain-containing protein n=1 Tax=Soboliphyme baturini TaxID=241478 RepID=A0A183IYK5_9BILA|nr:unnamed protein product [Soboliphyme baturini]
MRVKSNEYRKKKAELNDLNTELVVLHRTEQLLLKDAEDLGFIAKSKEDSDETSEKELVMILPKKVLKGRARARMIYFMYCYEFKDMKKRCELRQWRHVMLFTGFDKYVLSNLPKETDRLKAEVDKSRQELNDLQNQRDSLKEKLMLVQGGNQSATTDYIARLEEKMTELNKLKNNLLSEEKMQMEKQPYLAKQIQIYKDAVKLMEGKIKGWEYKE